MTTFTQIGAVGTTDNFEVAPHWLGVLILTVFAVVVIAIFIFMAKDFIMQVLSKRITTTATLASKFQEEYVNKRMYAGAGAIQEGLAEKLDKDSLENIKNINPLYQGQFYDPDDEYTVPYGAGIPLIVYDPEQVDIDIKGYKDLWDPSLEDSIALTANYRVLNGITQLSMGESMNEEDVDVIKKTGEKLLELAPNVRLIQDDNTQNALLNGEASVAFLYTSQVTAALAENPDLKVVYPEEGLGFGIMGMFIPSEAPDKDAAYSFMDYIMQPEVAAKCTDYIGYYSTNKAADKLVNPDLVVPDDVTKGEIVQNVSQDADAQYQKNWTEFKAACD